jgi:hypothetical protein
MLRALEDICQTAYRALASGFVAASKKKTELTGVVSDIAFPEITRPDQRSAGPKTLRDSYC